MCFTNSNNHWFEFVDSELKDVARLKCQNQQSIDPKTESLLSSYTKGHDPFVYLWTAGDGCVGIVDIERMEYDLVPRLGGSSSQENLAHALLSVFNGRKVLSVIKRKGADSYFLNYWQKSANSQVMTVPAESIDPDCILM